MSREEVRREEQEEAHEGQEGQVAPPPALRVLSLGAGVQSTTLALLAVEGVLPKPDAAIFADTGWEPRAVYEHLDRLEKVMADAGIPLHRVQRGNIRDDVLGEYSGHFGSMPLHVLNQDGTEGRLPQSCTATYKKEVVKAKVRELMGFVHPKPVPRGVFVEQWIGISTDEIGRVKDSDVKYQQLVHPLIDLGMSRRECDAWLVRRGWKSVKKSACIGCPNHGNAFWRRLRDESPDEWQDAVSFDAALREYSVYSEGSRTINGTPFLHRSRVPLDQAPIDRVSRKEWSDRQTDIFGQLADLDIEEDGDPDGCGPFTCHSGEAVT